MRSLKDHVYCYESWRVRFLRAGETNERQLRFPDEAHAKDHATWLIATGGVYAIVEEGEVVPHQEKWYEEFGVEYDADNPKGARNGD